MTHTGRGGKRNAYGILIGKSEGKRAFGRPRHRYEDNVEMDQEEIGWENMDQVYLAQDRGKWWAVVNMVMNLWVPGNFLTL